MEMLPTLLNEIASGFINEKLDLIIIAKLIKILVVVKLVKKNVTVTLLPCFSVSTVTTLMITCLRPDCRVLLIAQRSWCCYNREI